MTFAPQNLERAPARRQNLQPAHVEGSEPLGKLAGLQVRLARTNAEIEAAQQLRHRVFRFETGKSELSGRDCDHFDT